LDAPQELSEWLFLFYAYLEMEKAHADALELHNLKGNAPSHAFTLRCHGFELLQHK